LVSAVLYAIESTSKYFAVKNYWRGTITAFYQTRFPTDAFLIEELPVFMLLGFLSGMMGAIFIFAHRHISIFRQRNRVFKMIFRNK
ncbi:hypothetical protein COOONC_04211, partial [Cooperia oncophora]